MADGSDKDGTAMTGELFISRAGKDEKIAKLAPLVAHIFREAGYTTFLQDENFGHASFMARMDEGFNKIDRGGHVVALLSSAYMRSEHCMKEARYPLIDDPDNKKERLVVLRIEECVPSGFLKDIPYVDLVPLLHDATAFARAVRGSIERAGPEADFAQLHRRAPTQILHPDIRPVPSFTGRDDLLDALEKALWQGGGKAALTDAGDATPSSPRPSEPGPTQLSNQRSACGDASGSRTPAHRPGQATPAAFPGRHRDIQPPSPSNSGSASAAIHGLGGVGKSVLAQEYGWRNRARYHGVWWVRAETEQTLLDDLITLGSRLVPGLDESQERDRAAHLALDAVARTGAETPWLLVYDNAESPAALDKLTPATGAHLIVTSRWSDWYGHAEALPVDVFPPEVAADYLMEHARHPDRDAAARLAEALGWLPLALSHARAACWRMNWTFDAYREKLPELIDKAPPNAGYPATVFATFSLAIERLAEACPEAEKLMAIAAFLAPDRIPLDLITADVMSESTRDEALAALADVSLITHEMLEDGTRGFSVHRLVQAVMQARLADEGKAQEAALEALAIIADAFPSGDTPPDDVRNWPACVRLLPHAKALLPNAPDQGDAADKTSLLCNQIAVYVESRADYSEAEPLYVRSVAIFEKAYGEDHPNVAAAVNNLAGLLRATGRLDEAEPLMRRALEIDEAAFGPDHPNVAIRLNNLAQLLQATNRPAEAEPLMRRALAIDEAALGPDHPNVAIRLNNLAGLLADTNRLDEAEPLYRRALAIDEAALGPDHPKVATDLNNLAALLQDTNRLAEAEPLYERAVAIFETSLGPDHPNTQKVKANYERFKAKRGDKEG